jgi:hypothetical protein
LIATSFSLIVIAVPQWISAVWSLFSAEPLFQWLLRHNIPHLAFSPWWITAPMGGLMFAVVLWTEFSRNPSKKNSRLIAPGGDGQWRAPQPIVIALAELKTLLNEGRTMLAKYQVDAAPNPTFVEVEDYRKRTLDGARQQVFGLTPKQLATFEQPWDEEESLLAQAEMVDHGFIKDGSPDMAIYRHLWSRVKRLNELISLIESK